MVWTSIRGIEEGLSVLEADMPASIGPPGREINFGAAEMCDDDPVA
ncbi:hypothetical protein GGD56_006942 [Rhizobium mongolense]|uniref:Uncharacterized protein n=2 Tax=Rhizobium mongolense TaxID=57676 RepID=A0ABR6IYU9_9HYPH|nr:hypothetical protein [Rhizobium mongolense]TVZ74890.1 hypothetical protein BCL32_0223 [Rhizobium mongolense USDA 1844]